MHEKHEDEQENSAKTSLNTWLLAGLGVLFVLSALQTFQIASALDALNTRTTGSTLSGSAALSQAALPAAALNMSDWTANEKMNYEMHGIIPARAQSTATAPPNSATDITQGLPSQVGGC